MIRNLACFFIAFLCFDLLAIGQQNPALHLEIAVPSYARHGGISQPRLSVRNVVLTTQGQQIPIKVSQNFSTHLLVIFSKDASRFSNEQLLSILGKLLQAKWQISIIRANDCPTPYLDGSANLLQMLSAPEQGHCHTGNALQQLANFAGRRVLFLVGPDRETQPSYLVARQLLIPCIYLVDGGVKSDFVPSLPDRSYRPHSDIQVQTIDSGAEYGLINEYGLKQASNDALDASHNFYDFVLTPSTQIRHPIELTFRHLSGSGNAQLYAQTIALMDGQPIAIRTKTPVPLVIDPRAAKPLSQSPTGMSAARLF